MADRCEWLSREQLDYRGPGESRAFFMGSGSRLLASIQAQSTTYIGIYEAVKNSPSPLFQAVFAIERKSSNPRVGTGDVRGDLPSIVSVAFGGFGEAESMSQYTDTRWS